MTSSIPSLETQSEQLSQNKSPKSELQYLQQRLQTHLHQQLHQQQQVVKQQACKKEFVDHNTLEKPYSGLLIQKLSPTMGNKRTIGFLSSTLQPLAK